LLEEHNWIQSDKEYFGKPDTMYCFKKVDPTTMHGTLDDMKAEAEDLKRKVNFKVDLMFEKTEKWHKELLKKREITSGNKTSLEEAIKILDKEKNNDVMKTVKEVNRHFNGIFSVLLPGCEARLENVFSNMKGKEGEEVAE